jgi:hypothetical protein
MNKGILIGLFVAGLVTMCLLSYFGIFNCAGCGESITWDGQCTANITEECCMDIRMCGGIVDNPSLCYTKYCEASGEHCVPVDGGEIQEGQFECKCESIYV